MGSMSERRDPALVGRVRERGALAEVLQLAARGHPGALVVHGEAGVGKTRLVRDGCAQAQDAGYTVLWGTCVRFGSASLPYAPLASALDRWASQADRSVSEAVFAGVGELMALLPSLGVRGVDAVPGTVPAWIETVLLRMAAWAPTVLVVDDLQWADAASLDALAYLVTGFAVQHLAIVATVRLEERPEGHPLHTWLADVRRLPHVSELTLERLDARETQAQIEQLLGAPASEEYVEDVHGRSRGNAYLTELLVKDAPTDARRLPVETTQALREAVLARWHTLSKPGREVTRLLALGGRPASYELLRAVTASSTAVLGAADLTGLVREALDAGVLRVGGDRTYWFWHPLLAEVLIASIAPGDAVPVHEVYAAGLEPLAGDGPTALAADLAVHHEAAGHLDEAFTWSLRAADYAARVHARAGESGHLSHACSLWDEVSGAARGDAAQHVSLLRQAASAAYAIGDYGTSVERLQEALELVDPTQDPLMTSALLVAWTRADWELSPGQLWYRPEMRRAIQLTDNFPDSPERAVALGRLAEAQAWDDAPDPLDRRSAPGDIVPGRAAAEAALAIARRSGSSLALAHALTAHAMVTLEDPDSGSLVELDEARELARGLDATWAAEASMWQVNRLQHEGRLAEAAERGRVASSEALQAGSTHYGHFLAAHGAFVLIDLGRWDEARELLRPALGSGGAGITGAFARCDAALLALRTGQVSEARRHLGRVAEIVRPDFTGVPITEVTVEMLLAEGRAQAAFDYIEKRWPLHVGEVSSEGLDALLVGGATAAADWAEQARDRGDEPGCTAARSALEALTARRAALPGAPFQSALKADHPKTVAGFRFAAECVRCRGDSGQAEAWQRVRDAAASAGLLWEEALAGFRLGQALLAQTSQRQGAAEALRAAHAIASGLGAQPLRAEVESLARSARLSLETVEIATAESGIAAAVTVTSETGLAPLTDREQEILRHVVAGRSNGEIARALFISTKTVSVHVSNILRKTGSSSRIEAAAWARRVARGEATSEGAPDARLSPIQDH